MLHQFASFSRKLHKYLNQKNAVNPVQYMVLIGGGSLHKFFIFLEMPNGGRGVPAAGAKGHLEFFGRKNRRQDFLAAVTVCLWSYVGVSNW